MPKGKMIVLTNAVSAAHEADYNIWYNEAHAPNVAGLPGFLSVTRYRAKAQLLPPLDTPAYRYLAIYELDDTELAMSSLVENADKFDISDAIDANDVQEYIFEPFFTYSNT